MIEDKCKKYRATDTLTENYIAHLIFKKSDDTRKTYTAFHSDLVDLLGHFSTSDDLADKLFRLIDDKLEYVTQREVVSTITRQN